MTELTLIPAATVVVVRDGASGVEVLMLKRSSRGAFSDHWVFPGGKVDATDHHPADSDPLMPFRRAAVREAAEEAAISVAPDELVSLAYWEPPIQQDRRYNTWFFLARAQAGDVTVDGTEIHDHDWVTPEDMLLRRDQGKAELAAPTWMSLHQISRHTTVAGLLAAEAARETPRFSTHLGFFEDGSRTTMWAGDAGYEAKDALLPGQRNRLVMDPNGWRYEGSFTSLA